MVDKLIPHYDFTKSLDAAGVKNIVTSPIGNLVLQNQINSLVGRKKSVETVLDLIGEVLPEVQEQSIRLKWVQLIEGWRSGTVSPRVRLNDKPRSKTPSRGRNPSNSSQPRNMPVNPYLPPTITLQNVVGKLRDPNKQYDPCSPVGPLSPKPF